jgi:DNA-binding NtrC family response regulator
LMVLRELRTSQPETPIILMTAVGSVNLAVRAIEEGATDFIAKPFEVEALADLLRRHLKARVETGARPHSPPAEDDGASPPEDWPSVVNGDGFSGLIGRSPAMVKTYKLIAHAARMDATVLITGESGAGKELAARCWRRSCSGTRKAPSRARPGSALDSSRPPAAVRCSWTNWLRRAPRFRQACCACCSQANCVASAPHKSGG